MTNEDIAWVLVVVVIIAAIASCIIGGCHEVQETERAAIKAGLVQEQNGCGGTVLWRKPTKGVEDGENH